MHCTSSWVLLLLSSLPLVRTWVVLSRHSAQIAFHSALDTETERVITTGVLFQTPFRDYTLGGASDSDCFIALNDVHASSTGSKLSRSLYETPQLCTHFELFPQSTSTATTGSGTDWPAGVSAGMDGNRGTVSSIRDITSLYADWKFQTVVLLPTAHFPVALTTDHLGRVYVGMHSTGGILPPAGAVTSTSESNGGLINMFKYYQQMTHPNHTTQVVSPKIVRINMLTGATDWTLELTTTEGRSTIGGMVHIPSRHWIVVAGSSNGRGSLVGAGEWSSSWDGYITRIHVNGTVDDAAGAATYLAAQHSTRVQSQVGKDDYIHGICASGDNIFIVGSTTGEMTADVTSEQGGAFIKMLDIDTFQVKWTKQWPGLGVAALKCSATSGLVYVAGQVPGGTLLNDDRRSFVSSTQDLFASLLDTNNGKIFWTRQIDSRKHDTVANIFVSSVTGDLIMAHNAMDFERGNNEIITSTFREADGFHDWQDWPESADPLLGRTASASDHSPSSNDVGVTKESNGTAALPVMLMILAIAAISSLVIIFVSRRRKSIVGREDEHGIELEENGVSDDAVNDLSLAQPPPEEELGEWENNKSLELV